MGGLVGDGMMRGWGGEVGMVGWGRKKMKEEGEGDEEDEGDGEERGRGEVDEEVVGGVFVGEDEVEIVNEGGGEEEDVGGDGGDDGWEVGEKEGDGGR